MVNGQTIIGRKQNNGFDFYETPEWATQIAVEAMLRDGIIHTGDDIAEPCCGAGAITKVLRKNGFVNIVQSDIQTADYISGEKGIDVYNLPDKCCDVVITNPPYNLMTLKEKDGGSMLKQFLRIANKKVILLLNIFFLSSRERKELLEGSHLRHIYVHSDRVTMYPYGQEKPKNGGTKMFAWFVWDKEYNGKPTLSLVERRTDGEINL